MCSVQQAAVSKEKAGGQWILMHCSDSGTRGLTALCGHNRTGDLLWSVFGTVDLCGWMPADR